MVVSNSYFTLNAEKLASSNNIKLWDRDKLVNGNLSREFYMAAKAVSSPIILGHLRLISAGTVSEFNNHPFKLSFLGYDWTMVHNGTATNYEALVPHDERLLLESDNDSARVFEFLRKRIIEYYLRDSRKSLIEGCRRAYSDLLRIGGKFNIILSNGQISFVFIHWRTFYLLQREKQTGAATLISTLKLTDDEEWIKIEKLADRDAKNQRRELTASGCGWVIMWLQPFIEQGI